MGNVGMSALSPYSQRVGRRRFSTVLVVVIMLITVASSLKAARAVRSKESSPKLVTNAATDDSTRQSVDTSVYFNLGGDRQVHMRHRTRVLGPLLGFLCASGRCKRPEIKRASSEGSFLT
jgi:hypothetical protein